MEEKNLLLEAERRIDELMRQNAALAAEVERLSVVQGEPVAWYTEDHLDDKSATTYNAEVAQRWRVKGWPVWPLYTATQPSPDVSALVEALEEIAGTHHHSASAGEYFAKVARKALATHRKGDDAP